MWAMEMQFQRRSTPRMPEQTELMHNELVALTSLRVTSRNQTNSMDGKPENHELT